MSNTKQKGAAENKQVSAQQDKSPQENSSANNNKQAEQLCAIRPVADIEENKDGAVVYVDMPGVSKDSVDIDVENNILTITGSVNLNMPENLHPTYVDLSSGRYERRFTLSSELDAESISASLNQGELVVKIPRAEQHRPRKIEIKTA